MTGIPFPSLFRDAQVDIGHEGRPWWGTVGQVPVAQMVEAWS